MDISSYPHAIYRCRPAAPLSQSPPPGRNAPCGLDKNAGDKAVKTRYEQQGGKLFVTRSRQPLHIAVNDLQRLLFRHDPLQGFVGRNAR